MRALENTRMWPSSVHSLSHLPLIYVVCVKASVCRVLYTPCALSEKEAPLRRLDISAACRWPLLRSLHTHSLATSHDASLRSRPPGTRSGLIYPWTPGVPSPTPPRLATDDCIFDVQRGSAPIYHLLMWHLTFITRVLEHATAIENELH